MSSFRPLSARGQPAPTFDGLAEGLPSWLKAPVIQWLRPLLYEYGRPSQPRMMTLQVVMRLDPPLPWANGAVGALRSLVNRVESLDEFGLDVLDGVLHLYADQQAADALDGLLEAGGSAWEVTDDGDLWQLTRRAVGPVVATIDAIRTPSQRAHHHLTEAWAALMGRNPNPSTAYREAIKAVEAAAKPVVTPNDDLATLGKIIRAIRDKPEKWTVTLDKATALGIADMCDLVWKGQQDRHGTDDPAAPLAVSQEEADAAFHVALSLVRLFVSGGVRLAS